MESVLAGFSLVRGMHDHVPGIIKVHQRLHIYIPQCYYNTFKTQ